MCRERIMKHILFVIFSVVAVGLGASQGLAQPAPPFVVQGPTVVADKCAMEITDCVSVSYPQNSPIAQRRVAPVPRGNVEFDIPVVSNGFDASACGSQISFSASVNVVGPNPAAGETVSASASTALGFKGGSAVLRLPVNVDWIESVVTFRFSVSQPFLSVKPPAKPGLPVIQTCESSDFNSGGPSLSSISLPSNLPFSVPSNGFLLLVAPAAAFQIPLLPVGIVYGPLGNGPKAGSSLQLTNITGTNQQFTNSQGQTNATTNDDKTQLSGGITLTFAGSNSSDGQGSGGGSKQGVNIGVTASGTWDYSTETDNQTTYGQTGSLATIAEMQNTYFAVPAPNEPPVAGVTYSTQPFWQDIILAVTNAQYAAFDYPAGAVLAPLGSASVVELPVRQLDRCISSSNAIEPMSMSLPSQWIATHAYPMGSAITDPNGNIEVTTTAGTSGKSAPTNWNTYPGGTTVDASVTWTNDNSQFYIFRDSSVQNTSQVVWAQQWAEKKSYPAGAVVYGYPVLTVVTKAGTSGANIPSWNQQSGGITSDGAASGGVTWTTEQPQMWSPNHSYAVGAIVYDPNNDFQVVTTAGVSGASPPNWSTTTTTDGTVGWTIEIPQAWAATHSYSIGTLVNGSAAYIQVATTGGTSGATGPAWNLIAGSTTADGTVVWTDETDHFAAYAGPIDKGMTVWQWLSSADCTNIAKQDQFYVKKVQSAAPLAYIPIASGQGINTPAGFTCMSSNQIQTTVGATQSAQNTTKVTSIISNSTGISGGINFDLPSLLDFLNISVGANGSWTQSGSQTISNTAFEAQTLSSQKSITGQVQASTTMQDQPPPATNIPVNCLQDLIYIGIAVQDTALSPTPPTEQPQVPPPAIATSAAYSLTPELQGLPVVPIGQSDLILRRKGMAGPTKYLVQTPDGYVAVERSTDTTGIAAKLQALQADAVQSHIARPIAAAPPAVVNALGPTDTLRILSAVQPSAPVQNAIKRLSAQSSP
jgi:hypothetical protein